MNYNVTYLLALGACQQFCYFKGLGVIGQVHPCKQVVFGCSANAAWMPLFPLLY